MQITSEVCSLLCTSYCLFIFYWVSLSLHFLFICPLQIYWKGIGLICCIVAIIGFGTQGIFVKSPKVLDAGVHPLLMALLYSFCIAVVGGVIGSSVFARGESYMSHDHKKVYGPAVAAIAFAPGNLLLLWSCRRIGIGFAVGVVASTASISSFIIGTLICGDSVNFTTQVPGILLMVLGIVLISATKVPMFEVECFFRDLIHIPFCNPFLHVESDRHKNNNIHFFSISLCQSYRTGWILSHNTCW